MTNNQRNKFRMYKVVVSMCAKNPVLVSKVPAFEKSIAELTTVVEKIEQLMSGQTIRTTGITEALNDTKIVLNRQMAKVTNSLFVYAVKNYNLALRDKTSFTPSALSKLSHVARIATCSGLISEIKSNPNLAADAGLPETEIARLETLLAEYKMQYVQPREQKVGSTVVTKELQNTFIIADKILKFETDKLAILFIDDYPGFYLTYRNARKIEDLGIRHMSNPKMSSDENANPKP